MPKFKYSLYRLSPHEVRELVDVYTRKRDALRAMSFYKKHDRSYAKYHLERL